MNTSGEEGRPSYSFAVEGLQLFYGEKQVLFGIDLTIPDRQVTALIGPSGCGKSSFLRCLNRMNDTIPSCRITGQIMLDNEDIYAKEIDVVQLRARVGMVFQKPNPFPKSIYENIAYGPRIHGMVNTKAELDVSIAGVAVKENDRIGYVIDHHPEKLPDIITTLQNETNLTRKTIVEMLICLL